MYHLIEALSRWLMPILSFTAEEIWQAMPGERSASVLLATWYDGLIEDEADGFGADVWQVIMRVRDAVNKVIEAARNERVLGSSLAAEVIVFVDAPFFEILSSLGDEIAFCAHHFSGRGPISRGSAGYSCGDRAEWGARASYAIATQEVCALLAPAG